MKLVEGTRYSRRLDQPSPRPIRAKEVVDCLICGVPSDSEDENVRRRLTKKQVNQGIRLDILLIHYKGKHLEAFPAQGRSLLDMGLSVAGVAPISSDAIAENEETVETEIVGLPQSRPPPRQTANYPPATA
jgi:hypothetical protein